MARFSKLARMLLVLLATVTLKEKIQVSQMLFKVPNNGSLELVYGTNFSKGKKKKQGKKKNTEKPLTGRGRQ